MNRKHTVEEYLDIINKLKIRPDIEFSSDFIIGYPGETQDDFDKTIQPRIKSNSLIHFSLYSARPGTPAFKLKNINLIDAKKRLIKIQHVAENIKKKYRKKLIKKNVKVLFENKMKIENRYFGRDEFFNSVIVESNENLIGKIKEIKILKANQNTLFGEISVNLDQTNHAA